MLNYAKTREEVLEDTNQIIDDLNDISEIEDAVMQIIVDLNLNDEIEEKTDYRSKISAKESHSLQR